MPWRMTGQTRGVLKDGIAVGGRELQAHMVAAEAGFGAESRLAAGWC